MPLSILSALGQLYTARFLGGSLWKHLLNPFLLALIISAQFRKQRNRREWGEGSQRSGPSRILSATLTEGTHLGPVLW